MDIPIVTGFSHARNIIIVRSSHLVIAIHGGYGTLSEIAFALKLGRP
ncbi:TIGR00725 family protein, partial [candidate division CSSED10-310 bacterium]